MIQRKPTLRRVGFIIFSLAVILGILLILMSAIPDLEASMYGFIKYDYPTLTTFSCPRLMTSLDRQPVTLRVNNPLDRPLNWYINVQFSSAVTIITKEERLELQPGETKTLTWEVGNENIDLGYFIFARAFTSSSSSLGMREGTCGTFVLKLPIKGGLEIFNTSLIIALLGLALGLWLWSRHSEKSDPDVASQTLWMHFITVIVAVGIVAAIINSWFLAIVMVILVLLSTGVFLIPSKT